MKLPIPLKKRLLYDKYFRASVIFQNLTIQNVAKNPVSLNEAKLIIFNVVE